MVVPDIGEPAHAALRVGASAQLSGIKVLKVLFAHAEVSPAPQIALT
jgi:hypothetical protein